MVNAKNELIAECCVCGQHVPFMDGDRNNLLKHSEESHGKERVVRYDILKPSPSSTKKSKSDTSCSKTSKSSKSSKYDITNQNFQFGHAVVCSSCGHIGPPLLRRQGRSKKPMAMFTGCCPLLAMVCFLSCFTPRVAHVYCTRCKTYLGTYNTRNGTVTKEVAKDEGKEGGQEVEKKDSGKKDSGKKGSGKKDAAKKDSGSKDAGKKEPVKKDSKSSTTKVKSKSKK